ncbi:MAG: MarR family transcriptional regulator [Nitriliruptor sp.]|nr:MAG: MarR family transcriptional regulator [Nitriliruptor sp.]
MCGTHTYMTTAADHTLAPSPLDPAVLDRLDDALVEVRRVLQRPGHRRAVLGELAGTVGLQAIRVLRLVERAEHAPTIGAVAEALVVDPSTASRTVDRAVAAGLLQRHACSDDGRRARLHLTGPGCALLAEVSARRRAVLARAVGDWEPADVDTLHVLLERLLGGFDAAEVAP